MESLYTKYRPAAFADVVGQNHVVATLERAVLEGRVGHAYLFCGPRGTGKTTLARILAKALLCSEGKGKLPDGTCEECQLIAQGTHPDVLEIDAASNTGVDNVRDAIIGRIGYAPVRGNHKVYIVDEVHMLTTAAFNALLKTLEEPPENVTFVLCTTDPQRIPATILSRVQRFDFHAIGNNDIRGYLERVCASEGFEYEPEALDLIVQHAHGGMRDALTTLEQVSVNDRISTAAVRDLHGEVPDVMLSTITRALAQRNVVVLFENVASLVDDGRDLLQFVRELASRIRDLYVLSALGTTENILNVSEEKLALLKAESDAFASPDRLARILTILGDVSNEMRLAPNQRLSLEIALTRIARPEGDLTLESLAERVSELERGGVRAPAQQVVPPVQQAPAQQVAPPAQQVAPPAQPPVQVAPPVQQAAPPVQPPVQVAPPVQQPPVQQVAPPAQQPSVQATPPAAQVFTPEPVDAPEALITDRAQLQRKWRKVQDRLMVMDAAKAALLTNSSVREDDGDRLTVVLPKGSTFALRMLEREDVKATIHGVILEEFGPRKMVYTESADALQDTQEAEFVPEAEAAPSAEAQEEALPLQAPEQGLSLDAVSTTVSNEPPRQEQDLVKAPLQMQDEQMPAVQTQQVPTEPRQPEAEQTKETFHTPPSQQDTQPSAVFENKKLENVANVLTDVFGAAIDIKVDKNEDSESVNMLIVGDDEFIDDSDEELNGYDDIDGYISDYDENSN